MDAVVQCPWYTFGPEVRRKLVILMANSKAPVYLTCGKVFRVDMEMCAMVSVSAFIRSTLVVLK